MARARRGLDFVTPFAIRTLARAFLACSALAIAAAPAAAVVGGQPVSAGQFDYVANVEIFGQAECTGVLLAPAWVITAGHCASISGAFSEGLAPSPITFPASAYTVFLGTPNTNGSGGELHKVSQVVIDPDFLVTNGDGNDVSLLHLSAPSKQPTMQIAPDDPELWAAGTIATVAGFGTTSESSSAKPPTMRYAHVPFVTDAYCAQKYPFGTGIVANDGWYDPKTMVCAGYAQGGTDVCEGDSGGPILAPGVAGKLELIGTTSFGHGCAEPGYPTAYALAAAGPIREFLEQHVPSAFATDKTPAHASKKDRVHKHAHHKRGSRARKPHHTKARKSHGRRRKHDG
jgi:trypsin